MSCTRQNKNAIGEEGNGKPPHEFKSPRKNSEPCLWFLLPSKSNMLNTIDEEGNLEPPHKIDFPRKDLRSLTWSHTQAAYIRKRAFPRSLTIVSVTSNVKRSIPQLFPQCYEVRFPPVIELSKQVSLSRINGCSQFSQVSANNIFDCN